MVLANKDIARFSDLRPSGVDTNSVSYHLKLLSKGKFIRKLSSGYSLDSGGLIYVERINRDSSLSYLYPRIVVMLLIQDSEGQILLQRHDIQPFINTWTLPRGEVTSEDASIEQVAWRIGQKELGLQDPLLRHVGDCYVRVTTQQNVLSSTFVHVFRYEIDTLVVDESYIWVQPIKLHTYVLSPAIEQIIARSFFGDAYFFAEFQHDWIVATS